MDLIGLKAVQSPTHDVDGIQLLIGQKEILPAGAGLGQVDGREDTLLGQLLSRIISILPVLLNSS